MGKEVKRGLLGYAISDSHVWVMVEASKSAPLKLVTKEQMFHRPLFKKHQIKELMRGQGSS